MYTGLMLGGLVGRVVGVFMGSLELKLECGKLLPRPLTHKMVMLADGSSSSSKWPTTITRKPGGSKSHLVGAISND